jgi:3',5'-cyclic AMP phosphodiesterase CpdA
VGQVKPAEMVQFRGRNASLWQSAIDQATAKRSAGSPAAGFGPAGGSTHLRRPQQTDAGIQFGNEIASAIDASAPVAQIEPPATVAVGVVDTVKFCATTAYRLAEAAIKAHISGDFSEVTALHAQLDTPFGQCDPKWGEVISNYIQSRISSGQIPYRRYANLQDFVINDRLPDNATVVLIADWGTGQDPAKALLQRVASHSPDVVIHLGDVYYSGTQSEVQNYFYAIWQSVLGIPKVNWGEKLTDLKSKPATFHLPGNHDMYSGGGPYYTVIDMLGQPSSYFCLRNSNWQFIAMDTSLHDSNPVTVQDATWVDDQEIAWIQDKVSNSGGRKTILLSHHQLFSAFEKIAGNSINQKLLPQVRDIVPHLSAWLWGHEHNMVIYKQYLGVLGRCIGHGAFPVSDDPPPGANQNVEVPLENVRLSCDSSGFYRHGYVLMKINGSNAKLSYFQFDADAGQENELFSETL